MTDLSYNEIQYELDALNLDFLSNEENPIIVTKNPDGETYTLSQGDIIILPRAGERCLVAFLRGLSIGRQNPYNKV